MEPTPPASESHEALEELSESQFNYEMQNNWSMIFTDDNNSTDHDLRSNYSSSVDEGEAGNDMELVSESGIVSETDSDFPSFRYLSSRAKDESNATLKTVRELGVESQELSTATLKNSVTENTEGSYHFPDPLSASKQLAQKTENTNKEKLQEPATKTDKIQTEKPPQRHPVLAHLKSYAVYMVLGLLVIDRSIQLFDLSLPSSKWIFGANPPLQGLPSAGVSPSPDDDSFDAVTIIRYATKTETYFIPDPTTSVETVYETTKPTMMPSWELAKQLYANFAFDAKVAGDAIWEKATQASEKATHSAKETLDEVPGWLHNSYDFVKEHLSDQEEFISSIPGYAKEKYTESMAVLSDWTKAAAMSAASIQDEGVGLEIKQGLEKVQNGVSSAFNFAKEDGATFLSNSLESLYVSSGKVFQESKELSSSWWNAVDGGVVKLVNDPVWIEAKQKTVEAGRSSWCHISAFSSQIYTETKSKLPSLDEMKHQTSPIAGSVTEGATQAMSVLNKQMSDLWRFVSDNAGLEEDSTALKLAVDRQIDNASRAAWITWKWFTHP